MKSSFHTVSLCRPVGVPSKYNNGFTIIELLVATAVTALLVSLMLTVAVNVLGGWSKSSGKLDAGGQARLVLNQLAADLQGAIVKRDGNVWLAATIQQNQDSVNSGRGDANVTSAVWGPSGLKKPSGTATAAYDSDYSLYIPSVGSTTPDLTTYRFGQGGVWLRFFTGVNDDNSALTNLTAPRAVAYQFIRLPTNKTSSGADSSEYRYLLFRSEVRPGSSTSADQVKSTFGQGYDLFASNGYNYPTDGTNGGTSTSDAGNIRRPTYDQIIANNVVDFGVRIWGRNSSGTLVIQFPTGSTNLGYAATTSTSALPPTPASGALTGMSYGFPEVAEVFVRILTDEGVKQLELLENGTITLPSGETWWSIVEKNSQVFTRRVDIKSQAL